MKTAFTVLARDDSTEPAAASQMVLVSGAPRRLGPLVAALRRYGYTVRSTGRRGRDSAPTGLGPFVCYVQLPDDISPVLPPHSDAATIRGDLLRLLHRLDLIDQFRPDLHPRGCVLVVLEESPPSFFSPREAASFVSDTIRGATTLRLAVVVGCPSPAEIAGAVHHVTAAPGSLPPRLPGCAHWGTVI